MFDTRRLGRSVGDAVRLGLRWETWVLGLLYLAVHAAFSFVLAGLFMDVMVRAAAQADTGFLLFRMAASVGSGLVTALLGGALLPLLRGERGLPGAFLLRHLDAILLGGAIAGGLGAGANLGLGWLASGGVLPWPAVRGVEEAGVLVGLGFIVARVRAAEGRSPPNVRDLVLAGALLLLIPVVGALLVQAVPVQGEALAFVSRPVAIVLANLISILGYLFTWTGRAAFLRFADRDDPLPAAAEGVLPDPG